MKVWFYNIHKEVMTEVIKEFSNVLIIKSTLKILEYIKPNDKFICFWNDNDTLERLSKINNEVFPSKQIIFDFAKGREKMTRFVEKHSKFTTQREYFSFDGDFEITVPKLPGSLKVVVKVGKEHRGQDKFLLYPGQKVKVKDGAIFEEFVEDAESIRVLLIGDKQFIVEYHDDPEAPRRPENEWIKNINPIIKVRENNSGYEDLIEDTVNMSKIMGYDYLAVDYVRNKEKTVALELNIYPGLAGDERVINQAKKYWVNKIGELQI